jgi:hypothetical protein
MKIYPSVQKFIGGADTHIQEGDITRLLFPLEKESTATKLLPSKLNTILI